MRQMTDSSIQNNGDLLQPRQQKPETTTNEFFLRQYLTVLNTKQFTMQCKEFEVVQ